MAEDSISNILAVVVDLNPVWWGEVCEQHDGDFSLAHCIEDVIVFANSHLLLSCKNKLAILAIHAQSSHFLFPPPDGLSPLNEEDSETVSDTSCNGMYETFNAVTDTIKDRIKNIILDTSEEVLASQTIVAGTIAMALCYIQRLTRENEMGNLCSRILVIKGSEDDPDQYMNLMNVAFSAQKQNITVDACVLGNDSGLLQQACDITGGTYIRIPQLQGLLQYLLWVFLPSVSIRDKLTLPPKVHVDYRAACFCHRKLIDVGYVCSVCLSIFCTFSPICSTCQSTFRLITPTKTVKKKTKTKT